MSIRYAGNDSILVDVRSIDWVQLSSAIMSMCACSTAPNQITLCVRVLRISAADEDDVKREILARMNACARRE